MSRIRRQTDQRPRSEAADARDLVDLAARMGIPPEDAVRQVAQLISDANHPERDDAGATPAAPTA